MKQRSGLAAVAAVLSLVAFTYTVAGHCYTPYTMDMCRNVVSPSPPSEEEINGEDCAIDSDSYHDELVGTNWYQNDGGHYCVGDTTYCGVAYICPISGTQFTQHLMPTNWVEFFDLNSIFPPITCYSCPVNF